MAHIVSNMAHIVSSMAHPPAPYKILLKILKNIWKISKLILSLHN